MSQVAQLSSTDYSVSEQTAFAPAALQTHLQAEEFERYEDKYLVPLQYKDELLELLYEKSRPSYLTPNTNFLEIESCYYESPTFQSYRDHFLGKPYRFKLRTRRYAPNGVATQDPANIELKSKDGETSRKFRFRVEQSDLDRLRDFLPIRVSSALVEINPTIPGEELSRRAKNISRLVAENQLRPICKVVYQRQAFERRGVRVTLDTHITSKVMSKLHAALLFSDDSNVRELAQAMADRFQAMPHALLEVKHRGLVPKWLDRFTVARTTGKVGFSKYCYSLTTHLLDK